MAGGIISTLTKTQAGHIDLLNSTFEAFDFDYISNTFKYTAHPLTRKFFQDAAVQTDGGARCEWDIRIRMSGTAHWTAPYATSANTIQNLTARGVAPWRAFEEKVHMSLLEENMNMGKAKCLDLMTPKVDAALEAITVLIEEAAAATPPTLTDEDAIYGLGYWLSPCGTVSSSNYVTATDTTGGFNGQLWRAGDGGASYTIGGIDASDVNNERHRSYCATHNGVMDSNLVQQIVRAATRTDFNTVDIEGIKGKSIRRTGDLFIAMGHIFCDQYEAIINSGPDWLNGDAAGKKGGKIRSIPVVRTPVLDNLSSNDVYGVNTRNLYGRVLNGMWMHKIGFVNDRDSMHTYTSAMLGQAQLVCDNRRGAGFRIHSVIAST